MVLDRLKVHFNREIHFTGEDLKGKVEFQVSEQDERIKWLKVHFREEHRAGHVQIEYTEEVENGKFTKRNPKKDKMVVLDKTLFILEPSEYKLNIGVYEYPFSTFLPKNLPPSLYTKSQAEIVYRAEAIIEIENDLPEEQIVMEEAPFFVNNIMDLNLRRDGVNEDLDLEETITYGPMCCANGPIVLEANLKRSGWVPGERVPLNVRVTNHSDKNLIIEMKMIQTVVFLVDMLVKPRDDDTIITYKMGSVKPGQLGVRFEHIFKVPPLPTQFRVDLMELDYDLEIEAITDGPEENLKINTDLCIGNVPLREEDGFARFKEKDVLDLPQDVLDLYPDLKAPRIGKAKRNLPYIYYSANSRHKLRDENGEIIHEPEPQKQDVSEGAKEHQNAAKNKEMTTEF